MKIFGTISKNQAEARQISRVLGSLQSVEKNMDDELMILSNFKYFHERGVAIDNDKDWRGEIDLAVFSRHRAIIYELKAKKIQLKRGTTDSRFWEYRYIENNEIVKRFPYFDQASKQRAFLIRDYLNDWKLRLQIPQPNHFVVDSRLVLLPGSDFTNFFYKAPSECEQEAFQEDYLSKVAAIEDQEFLKYVYSGPHYKTGYKKRIKLNRAEYTRLYKIINENGIIVKTKNWFKVLTEDTIIQDFLSIPLKPDKVDISFENRLSIPTDLGLPEIS